MKKIKVFYTSECPNCVIVKNFLKDKGIDYTSVNLSENRLEMINLRKKGIMSVPYTMVGEHGVLGSNKESLEALIQFINE